MLAGALTQEDEDEVLAELEAITQVSETQSLFPNAGTVTDTTQTLRNQGVNPFGP
jgi:hypothetical protein